MNYATIGEYATEARKLLDSIKGGAIHTMQTEFEALKQQFTDKLDAITPQLNAFVSQQKANVNSIFAEPDKRYQVLHTQPQALVVGGTSDKWYPVAIEMPAGVLTGLSIYRYVHDDEAVYGKFNGSLSLDVIACSSGYGKSIANVIVERYRTAGRQSEAAGAKNPFVGRIESNARSNALVVWLRGATSYHLGCDNGQVAATVYEAGDAAQGIYPSLDVMNISQGAHVSVPAVGYVRG
ncbi:hypothetical protein BIT28_16475 [Photobacterium proteolyticum]|uniref:Phage tail protein n=1 Tax=Photobacterium proteolyticum TaxID=1903952 RepID=A0A1Q9G7M8_9GAMM|nr:hypothetical protein [Photobacterium proteolyticum]OLQ70320.1 hypothetical protein BIT28_16475 [Photobacterium proteolyticum]